MRIYPEHYMEASAFRIESARKLHEHGRYSAAIYLSGVSIECLLRAFITQRTGEFDSRHDLQELFKQTGLEDMFPIKRRRDAGAWLGTVWARWKNNYRYIADDRLRSEFKRLKHDRGITGDFLKENSRHVISSAYKLRTIGELQWRRLKKRLKRPS